MKNREKYLFICCVCPSIYQNTRFTSKEEPMVAKRRHFGIRVGWGVRLVRVQIRSWVKHHVYENLYKDRNIRVCVCVVLGGEGLCLKRP